MAANASQLIAPTPDGPAAPSPLRRPAGRFVYQGGARPLAGYTIQRGVGQGGFGEIYYATSDAGKQVALKLIRRNLEVELRGIRQCLNLKHPNLLDLYDIRQDDQGDTWVVMEYVADQNLEDVLAGHPAGLGPEEALRWIRGMAAGVGYLHDRGIVHRDLKPGNIFSDEGTIKVGDYGLSKFISLSRRSGHTESVGTVHYMAPEVANGRYGKEIDIYALGVILYELLTGRVPFEGESVGEVLMKHLTAKPDVSVLPEPYRGVVARALEKDPALRFHSAAEMMAALSDIKPPSAVAPEDIKPRPAVALPGATNGRGFMAPAHRRPFERPASAMLVKPFRQRLTELVGSLLASSLVAVAMCVVMVLIEAYHARAVGVPQPEQFAWLLLVSIAGSWAVLVPAKSWEGFRGEPMLRRFFLMVLGMGLGGIAFGLSEYLLVGLRPVAGYPTPLEYPLPPAFYAEDGRPLLMAEVASFAALFFLIRWWRQADPLRKARFSLWTVLVSVVVAGAVAHVLQFPQPWLPMAAGTISVAVQLASPRPRRVKQL